MKQYKYNELVEKDNQLFFMNDFAECYEVHLTKRDGDNWIDYNNENCLRVYKDSPESFCLQIRTFKPTNEKKTGKPRNMIAHVSLSIENLRKILSYAESKVS